MAFSLLPLSWQQLESMSSSRLDTGPDEFYFHPCCQLSPTKAGSKNPSLPLYRFSSIPSFPLVPHLTSISMCDIQNTLSQGSYITFGGGESLCLPFAAASCASMYWMSFSSCASPSNDAFDVKEMTFNCKLLVFWSRRDLRRTELQLLLVSLW